MPRHVAAHVAVILKKGGNGSSCAAESVQQRERWKTIYRARCAAQSAAQRE